jgi:signal peptidase I
MRDTRTLASLVSDALAAGAEARFRVEGNSMYPTIRDGDVIVLERAHDNTIEANDILLVRHRARLLVHRLVDITSRGRTKTFLLQGDAKQAPDAPVHRRDIVGRVVAVRRRGRAVRVHGRIASLRRSARQLASIVRRAAVPRATTVMDGRRAHRLSRRLDRKSA